MTSFDKLRARLARAVRRVGEAAPPRNAAVLRWLAFVVAALATAVLVIAGTARSTVADAGFYRAALDREHAYDRLYDQVLVDPEASGVTRDLLARLPVPESVVTSNLKTVLPPTTARALAEDVIGDAVAYLRGEKDDLTLEVDLRPVLDNLGAVGNVHFADVVANLQDKPAPDYAAFQSDLGEAVDRIADGERPEGLPTLDLTEAQARTATDTVLRAVPADERAELRPRLLAALGVGDLATALAEVGPALFSGREESASSALRNTADGVSWDLASEFGSGGDELGPAREARAFTKLGLGWVQTGAILLGLASLGVLWRYGPRAPGRRLVRIGGTLACGGALTFVLALVVRGNVGGNIAAAPRNWPDTAARLLDDVQRTALDRLYTVALTTAAVPLTAGVLLTAGGWLWHRRATAIAAARTAAAERDAEAVAGAEPATGEAGGPEAVATPETGQADGGEAGPAGAAWPPVPAPVSPLPPRYRWGAVGVVAAALAGAVFVPNAFGGESDRRCNGREELCELRYDEVAQLASHNAMATSQDRFIAPLQDPSITGQLNDGVRALLIDTHRWETPPEITDRLAESDFTPTMQRQIRSVLNTVDPPRKGEWLCHAVCRGGALPLVPELQKIGDWLEQNPSDVVTLVVQDGISGADTRTAMRQAGLEDLAFTPADDPDEPWPTLGEMIDEDRRLVVFAEKADGPAPWYRNFYRYGMETPFAFRTPEDMTCTANRGGEDKQLFLMNHFITNSGGSRLDAGRINARDFVLDRARECERVRGRPVNLVAVDYATIGDARGAVKVLNDERLARREG
ncbi:membrane protein [Streptomyces sp. CNQ-509]|uniref:membrane protein n=1 Tax=Streptomyces sp. CNQ-509 TaxID=444103 RepID=UPI00062DF125|nr:membrane protein [Streptomyces sp. CNQ-509]AKH85909.1 membrane protein [Streptomyces sp. CNQ-509]